MPFFSAAEPHTLSLMLRVAAAAAAADIDAFR